MPPAVHARSGAVPIAMQAYGATTQVSRIRAHRPGRMRPFGANRKHSRCPRYDGYEGWNGDFRSLNRPIPRRPTICRRNVNRTEAGSPRRSPMLPLHGADAESQTRFWPARFVLPRTGNPPSTSMDARVARPVMISRGSFSTFFPGLSVGVRFRGHYVPNRSRNFAVGPLTPGRPPPFPPSRGVPQRRCRRARFPVGRRASAPGSGWPVRTSSARWTR